MGGPGQLASFRRAALRVGLAACLPVLAGCLLATAGCDRRTLDADGGMTPFGVHLIPSTGAAGGVGTGVGGGAGGADAGGPGVGPAPLPCPGIPAAGTDVSLPTAVQIATGGDLRELAIDDTYVYWTDAVLGTVKRTPKAGGTTQPLASGQDSPQDVVASGGTVWWIDDGVQGGIQTVVPGGQPVQLVDGPIPSAMDLALDDTTLYWTAFARVMRMPRTGGDMQVFADQENAAQGISVYGGFVYWVDYGSDQILREPSDASYLEVIAAGDAYHFPRGVIADCHDIYFTTGNYGNYVFARPVDGGAIRQVANQGGGIAIDAQALYVRSSDSLIRVDRASGQTTQLSDITVPIPGAHHVAVDDQFVYFIGDGGIWKRSKR
jgi:hypothetical protein